MFSFFQNTASAVWAITKATVSVSTNTMLLLDMIPVTVMTSANCINENTAQLVKQMPNITDSFQCGW